MRTLHNYSWLLALLAFGYLASGLPSDGDHHNNKLTIGLDCLIYFGQGTATNSGVVGVDNYKMDWLADHPNSHDIPARDIRLKNRTYTCCCSAQTLPVSSTPRRANRPTLPAASISPASPSSPAAWASWRPTVRPGAS